MSKQAKAKRRPNLRWDPTGPNPKEEIAEGFSLSRGDGNELAKVVRYDGQTWWRWFARPNANRIDKFEATETCDDLETAKAAALREVKRWHL